MHIINIKRVSSSTDTEVNHITTQYPQVFHVVGKQNNYAAKFYIDDSVPPVVSSARPFPFHLTEQFNNVINQRQEDGKIEEHEGPAPWISLS